MTAVRVRGGSGSPSAGRGLSGPVTVGDVSELGDIDMDQRPGMIVFIATHHFSRPNVDIGPLTDLNRIATKTPR